jgi:hypothetical protein
MNRTMNVTNHLTPEQLYELLDQPAAAGEARMHVAACERCATEFATLRESLDGFKLAATRLAEAKFSPMLQVRGGFFSGVRQSMVAWPMGLAAAGVLLAASVTMVHRAGPGAPVNTASVAAAPLESDEALLNSIDQDLSTSVPPSLEPLAMTSTDTTQTSSKR